MVLLLQAGGDVIFGGVGVVPIRYLDGGSEWHPQDWVGPETVFRVYGKRTFRPYRSRCPIESKRACHTIRF